MKAKRCPICGGKPQYVHYAIPVMSEGILFKRLECCDCGATVPHLMVACDDAIEYWNDINPGTGKPQWILTRVMTEPVREVEE